MKVSSRKDLDVVLFSVILYLLAYHSRFRVQGFRVQRFKVHGSEFKGSESICLPPNKVNERNTTLNL